VTPEGLKALVDTTQCKAWIYAEDHANGPLTHGDDLLRSFGLPSMYWILSNDGQERYAYDKTYAEAARDVITIIHTSGTTGKLIPRSLGASLNLL